MVWNFFWIPSLHDSIYFFWLHLSLSVSFFSLYLLLDFFVSVSFFVSFSLNLYVSVSVSFSVCLCLFHGMAKLKNSIFFPPLKATPFLPVINLKNQNPIIRNILAGWLTISIYFAIISLKLIIDWFLFQIQFLKL